MTKLTKFLILVVLIFGFTQGVIAQEDPNTPLFEIKNDGGQTVFAVYPGGVQIFIDESQAKATGGGFKVSRASTLKETTEDYFTVNPGDVQVLLPKTSNKAVGGGFKVSRASTLKKAGGGQDDFFNVTPDSTRVYVSESSNSGFAVGKLGVETGVENFLNLTPENYFIGHNSGKNTTGLYNLFLGYESGLTNLEGKQNTFIGYQSGNSNLDGDNNVYIGYQSGLLNSNGRFNVFLGYQTGLNSNNSAHDNVYIGYGTARDKQQGSGNVMLGKFAGVNSGESLENVIIGNYAGAMIELQEVPSSDSRNNVIIGNYAGRNGIGVDNVIIGGYSGYNLDPFTSKGNIFIGNEAGRNESGSGKLYIANSSTPNPLIFGDFTSGLLNISGTLQVNGEIISPSDVRLKENILKFTSGLSVVSAINSYYFDWNNVAVKELGMQKKKQIGVLAQELEKVLPEAVLIDKKSGYKSVDYMKLTPVIIQAIKEQNQIVSTLEQRVEILEREKEHLQNELGELEQLKKEMQELKALVNELKK
jgi:hypothetical protein